MNVVQGIQTAFARGTFGQGFCAGLLIALVIGGVGYQLLYWWLRIRRFFLPTRPSAVPGPSPAAGFGTCLESALWLTLLVVALGVVVLFVVTRG
jgi:hypothetical protein